MSLVLKGKIVELLEQVSGTTARGEWRKREFVIETDEQYPKKVCFTLFNDKIDLMDGYAAGSDVEVSFNLESREYNGRYFHNINAWKIDPVQDEIGGGAPTDAPEFIPEDVEEGDNASSDLPF